MNHDEAVELTERIGRENERRRAERAERIAKAKASAPSDKEPIELAIVKTLATTNALGLSDEELARKLEDIYYIQQPSLMTMKELADVIERLIFY